jgi:osmoprotectant transport system ATP-binding protein
VTHDLAEAALLADTVVLMRAGRIVQQGRVTDLVHAPAEPFVTTFVAAQRRSAFDGGSPT